MQGMRRRLRCVLRRVQEVGLIFFESAASVPVAARRVGVWMVVLRKRSTRYCGRSLRLPLP